MAIQNRRGNYEDFVPSKMLPGEFAVVQNGDPNATDGKAVYMAFQAGDVKRLTTYNELQTEVSNAAEEIAQDITDDFEQQITPLVNSASQSASNASASATQAQNIVNSAVADIQAAGTTQVAAVQAKGDEVLDSIPADYTDLSDDVTALKADLSDKDALTVGTAKQVVGNKFTEDKVPYLFRQSGGGLTVGNREYLDAVVGGSVVWNQLVQNGDFADTSAWSVTNGSLTVSDNVGTVTTLNDGGQYLYQSITMPEGHIVFVSADVKSDIEHASNLSFGANILKPYTITPNWQTVEWIVQKPSSANLNVIRVISDVTSGEKFYTKNAKVHDLTAMFGTEIADYIYALEQANAGDGVAFFKKLFLEDYYAYNPGELISVSGVSAHETVGFNQWDEELEVGYIDANGEFIKSDVTNLRSKNLFSILPSTSYYVFCGGALSGNRYGYRFYDKEKKFISGNVVNINTVVISPSNAYYMAFFIPMSWYGSTYKHDICINISDPKRNGTYEPYTKRSYPLDSTLTLRGVPKLVDGKVQYDGDRYLPDGTVERRYGVVDLGTLDWTYQSERFRSRSLDSVIKLPDSATVVPNIVCSAYMSYPNNVNFGNLEKGITVIRQPDSNMLVRDSSYTDVATFKAAMSGVMLIYELATPTTETATPYRSDQLLDAGGTEEFVSTGIVPVGHETRYAEDLIKKLESLPWDMSMIAPVETGTTASQAYAVGKYFVLNDQFCKAKTAIASGATFTLNTNYEVTTVADELYTALH